MARGAKSKADKQREWREQKKAVRVAENVAQTGKQKKRVECLGGLACGCGKLSVGAFGLACVKKTNLKSKISVKFYNQKRLF